VTVVRWTEQALQDLQSIREFIERDSPRYGRLVAERLYEATSRLEAFPLSGRIVPELGRKDIRELIVGDYLSGDWRSGHPDHRIPLVHAVPISLVRRVT